MAVGAQVPAVVVVYPPTFLASYCSAIVRVLPGLFKHKHDRRLRRGLFLVRSFGSPNRRFFTRSSAPRLDSRCLPCGLGNSWLPARL
jgi:hypothetical protein